MITTHIKIYIMTLTSHYNLDPRKYRPLSWMQLPKPVQYMLQHIQAGDKVAVQQMFTAQKSTRFHKYLNPLLIACAQSPDESLFPLVYKKLQTPLRIVGLQKERYFLEALIHDRFDTYKFLHQTFPNHKNERTDMLSLALQLNRQQCYLTPLGGLFNVHRKEEVDMFFERDDWLSVARSWNYDCVKVQHAAIQYNRLDDLLLLVPLMIHENVGETIKKCLEKNKEAALLIIEHFNAKQVQEMLTFQKNYLNRFSMYKHHQEEFQYCVEVGLAKRQQKHLLHHLDEHINGEQSVERRNAKRKM